MGILIAIIGGIVTLMCLVNGIAISPQSAVQQTVQELRYVEAALGAILFALGIAIHEIAVLRRVTAEKQSAAAVEKRKHPVSTVASTELLRQRRC